MNLDMENSNISRDHGKTQLQESRSFLSMPSSRSLPAYTEPLTRAFACGWLKLPVELRLKILGIMMCADYESGQGKRRDVVRWVTFADKLRRYLSMGPFIASFAFDVYYKHNLFTIRTEVVPEQMEQPIWLPPSRCRPLIRRLRIDLVLEIDVWVFVDKVASGEYGFDNIQHISVNFRWLTRAASSTRYRRFLLQFAQEGNEEPIVFNCKGIVTFTSFPRTHPVDRMKSSIRERIVFRPSS